MTDRGLSVHAWVACALLGALAACAGPATSERESQGNRGTGGTASSGGNAEPPGAAVGVPLVISEPGDASAKATPLAPGWYLVAIDTATRTYLDYVQVPASGTWRPETNGWPLIAQWSNEKTAKALRFTPFTPGDVVTTADIVAMLPAAGPAGKTINITSAPYHAGVSPADATDAIQSALNAAGSLAGQVKVDVLVPSGTFRYSAVLDVPANVRLRGAGGVLQATDPAHSAIHLGGDHSGALFLTVTSPATSRGTTPDSSGIWVGGRTATDAPVYNTIVVGNEVVQSMGAHVIGIGEIGGLWAFNYAHDGFADTFHHTGGSNFCQVVANRASGTNDNGDDLYAFVGYSGQPDPVHHCSCLANSGTNGHARGLTAAGAGFIDFEHNAITRTRDAGILVACDGSFQTFGSFNVTVVRNTIKYANQVGSQDGLLAYADSPTSSSPSATFGNVPNEIRNLTVTNNSFVGTAPGIGNGWGIEVRNSCQTGSVVGNTVIGGRAPGTVVSGSGFTVSGNTFSTAPAPAMPRSLVCVLAAALLAVGAGAHARGASHGSPRRGS